MYAHMKPDFGCTISLYIVLIPQVCTKNSPQILSYCISIQISLISRVDMYVYHTIIKSCSYMLAVFQIKLNSCNLGGVKGLMNPTAPDLY